MIRTLVLTRMSRFYATLIGLVVALLIHAPDLRPAKAADTAVAASGRGLLWKVERTGAPPNYLFGTIHLADPRVTELAPPVRDALGDADHLLVELVPDAAGLARLMEAMLFSDGRTLEQTVGPKLYADVRAAFVERGVPDTDVARFKPWAATMILSMPMPAGGMPLDLHLQVLAAGQGKSIEALETMEEQIAVFNDLSLSDQRALLEATVREHRLMPQRVEELTQAYLARDIERLYKLAAEHAPLKRGLHETVMQRLLTNRNRRMVERMHARLRGGKAFVAVGAAHLPGPDGLIALLRQDGYDVRAVY